MGTVFFLGQRLIGCVLGCGLGLRLLDELGIDQLGLDQLQGLHGGGGLHGSVGLYGGVLVLGILITSDGCFQCIFTLAGEEPLPC